MTENEWLGCSNLQPALAFLRGSGTPARRKGLLLAAAFFRRAWHRLGEPGRGQVETVERLAEEGARSWRLAAAVEAVDELSDLLMPTAPTDPPADSLEAALFASCAVVFALPDQDPSQAACRTEEAEEALHCSLLRDVFGQLPFRRQQPPAVPVRSCGLILELAQAAYNGRLLSSGRLVPGFLAVLADALEDAGCVAAELLTHLRSPGPHVRGCWAVDLLLGKG
jgi:hypothetical protein